MQYYNMHAQTSLFTNTRNPDNQMNNTHANIHTDIQYIQYTFSKENLYTYKLLKKSPAIQLWALISVCVAFLWFFHLISLESSFIPLYIDTQFVMVMLCLNAQYSRIQVKARSKKLPNEWLLLYCIELNNVNWVMKDSFLLFFLLVC